MKFTSEDLMKAMGLQVGDKVKNLFNGHIFIITDNFKLASTEDKRVRYDINWLIDKNIELLPRPKRVGDLKCGEYGKQNCGSCPIRAICVSDEYNNDTLYEKLELSHKYAKDQEIYDLLKARLDKEVE